MIDETEYLNAEGYCKKCRRPLGIEGVCYGCALNELDEKEYKRLMEQQPVEVRAHGIDANMDTKTAAALSKMTSLAVKQMETSSLEHVLGEIYQAIDERFDWEGGGDEFSKGRLQAFAEAMDIIEEKLKSIQVTNSG